MIEQYAGPGGKYVMCLKAKIERFDQHGHWVTNEFEFTVQQDKDGKVTGLEDAVGQLEALLRTCGKAAVHLEKYA